MFYVCALTQDMCQLCQPVFLRRQVSNFRGGGCTHIEMHIYILFQALFGYIYIYIYYFKHFLVESHITIMGILHTCRYMHIMRLLYCITHDIIGKPTYM